MPNGKTTKLYNNFTRGLITEAGFLNFPENASTDELNTVIAKKGNRYRRTGVNVTNSPITLPGASKTGVTYDFVWEGVSKSPQINFLVSQQGQYIYFFDCNENDVYGSKKSFFINLYDHAAPNASVDSVSKGVCSIESGKGYLFIAHPFVEPLLIEYNEDTDTISVLEVNIQIRDFDGVDDALANDEEPTTLSKEHQYNLYNQGWVPSSGVTSGQYRNPWTGQRVNKNTGKPSGTTGNDPIPQFYNKIGRYPGNNKQWWVAKAPGDVILSGANNNYKQGDFLPDVLNKLYGGNTRAPQGHFIVDAFTKDRSAISGISGLPVEIIKERPSAIAFYSGRIWYACNTNVYFSQILTNKSKAGNCYQANDPTGEDISDLLANDGGFIPIPETQQIVSMLANSNGLLVFSTNGVWSISGSQGGFSAKDYSVNKMSPVGMSSPKSIIETDDAVFWWADTGILAIKTQVGQFGPTSTSTNLTLETIQSFYNDISPQVRQECRSAYDDLNNVVYWLYRENDTDGNEYNRVLLLDLTLNSFYPWKLSDSDNYKIKNVYIAKNTIQTSTLDSITASGVPVTVNGNVLTTDNLVSDQLANAVVFNVIGNSGCYIGAVYDTSFVDWGDTSYDSYIETGYELFQDSMRAKQLGYVFVYLRRTEQTYSGDVLDDPSSCQMQVKWDWSSTGISNKWTTPVEVYRPGRFIPMENGIYDNGYPIIVTKNRVRGNGKSIQFRFGTSDPGRNFDLFGWSVTASGTTIP